MSIPKATPSPNARHFIKKPDGRDHEFVEMLRVQNIPGIEGLCMTNPDRPQPGVSADYWEALSRVEAKLEKRRADRAEAERAQQYERAIGAFGHLREIKEAREEEKPQKRKYPQSHYGGSINWTELEPIMIELKNQGMTWNKMALELGISIPAMRRRWKNIQEGVA